LDKAQQELIRGYLAKAREKARVARDLCAKGEWDDAISRAYYAAGTRCIPGATGTTQRRRRP